jgi:hypothetical protein
MTLTNSQIAALSYIRKYARSRKASAQSTIAHICKMADIKLEIYEDAVAKLKSCAKVALHFHPDRLDPNLKSVAQALNEQGFYKSQFETLLSNGKVAPHLGGDRDLWERQLYGGAYNLEGTHNSHRPKYGALDVMRHADGPAPRFGSCYFVLKNHVNSRCSFTYLDSHLDPKEKGTWDEFEDIMAALLSEAFSKDFALGEQDLSVPKLINYLLSMENIHQPFLANRTARNLNHYIEAQVHGDISLQEDVESLVADPSFQETSIGDILENICRNYEIQLSWHSGYALDLESVPSNFRGSTMPSLAKRVCTGSYLDAHMIGLAASSLRRDPASWSDRGPYDEVLQELKLLWHVLVTYGQPLAAFRL